jgi:gluconate:H+ symporter, GntP family
MLREILILFSALGVAITFIIFSARRFNLHPFLALLTTTLFFGIATGQGFAGTLQSIQSGFGSLMQQIGLVVVLGALLGTIMEQSGAMYTLGITMARLFKHRVSLAILATGLLVGIPVFADSGFIILSKMLPAVAPGNVPTVLSLATGLYASHTLVPPTPGPLTAAVNLGLNAHIGFVMLVAIAFSIMAGCVGWITANIFAKHLTSMPSTELMQPTTMPWWRAVLPIGLPIVLIAVGGFRELLPMHPTTGLTLQVLGTPAYALLVGVTVAYVLRPRALAVEWGKHIGNTMQEAGSVLLITAAGGAFGATIKSSGLESMLRAMEFTSTSIMTIMLIAFAIAALLKTAQGSTTSAMIITSALVGPIAAATGITDTWQRTLLLMALAGGSMTVSHVNDSYFWVIARFGHVDHRKLLQSYTPITAIMGISVFVLALLLSWIK